MNFRAVQCTHFGECFVSLLGRIWKMPMQWNKAENFQSKSAFFTILFQFHMRVLLFCYFLHAFTSSCICSYLKLSNCIGVLKCHNITQISSSIHTHWWTTSIFSIGKNLLSSKFELHVYFSSVSWINVVGAFNVVICVLSNVLFQFACEVNDFGCL